MQKFINKIQGLGQKVSQAAQALETAPEKTALVRENILSTVGQLRKMRADVQLSVTALQTDSEEKVLSVLREIDDSVDTLRSAGYMLQDVEVEISVPQRIFVHLEKVADVSTHSLRALLAAHEHRLAAKALLNALISAEELADKVQLEHLDYHQLVVCLGPAGSARICWRAKGVRIRVPVTSAIPATPAISDSAPSASSTLFGQGSFFGAKTATVPSEQAVVPHSEIKTITAVTTPTSAPAPAPLTAHADPLARFKKMPDLSKWK